MVRWKEASLLYLAVFSSCCIASSCTKPEDILKIVSFEDVSQVVGLEATLVCYADFIVTGIEVEYMIERDGVEDYLRNEIESGSSRVSMTVVDQRMMVVFSPVLAEDAGTYNCTATVNNHPNYSRFPAPSKTAELTVDTNRFVFLENPGDTIFYVDPGQDLTITVCQTNQQTVGGRYGPVTVTLEKDGMEFTDNSYTFAADGALTIQGYNVLDVNITTLTCVVEWSSTDYGKMGLNRTFGICIDGAPKLFTILKYVYFLNITVDGTTQYAIDCNLFLPYKQLEPLTTYTWYYPANTQQVVSRSVSTNSPYVDSSNRLVVTDAHPSHTGMYQCTGSNVFGSNSSHFNVTIAYPATVLWVQYWMIIIYVVVALAIIILVIALIVRFCCLGFCYVKDKKVVVDSTFYTTSKFDEIDEKIPLQDKTEFQEVEVDMQLAGIQDEESDEDYDLPPEVDVKPKAKYSWDDEEESAQLHKTEKRQLVRALKQVERPQREREQETFVEVHHRRPRRARQQEVAQIEVQPEPTPQPVLETPESQRKVDITQQQKVEVSPYEVDLIETQQRVVAQPMVVPQAKVVTKKVVTKTVEVIEDTEPLIDEDRMSGESQVFEATFGISDLESEEPPDSDFNF